MSNDRHVPTLIRESKVSFSLEHFTMPRHAAAFRASLVSLGIETVPKAFAKLAPIPLAAILTAWLSPTESVWLKAGAALLASIVVVAIIYFVSYLRYKPEPVKVGLSPLYTPAGQNHFRSMQRAEFEESARLTKQSEQLAVAMSKCDVTTEEGQKALRELAHQKKPIDERLAVFKKQQRRIGFFRP